MLLIEIGLTTIIQNALHWPAFCSKIFLRNRKYYIFLRIISYRHEGSRLLVAGETISLCLNGYSVMESYVLGARIETSNDSASTAGLADSMQSC